METCKLRGLRLGILGVGQQRIQRKQWDGEQGDRDFGWGKSREVCRQVWAFHYAPPYRCYPLVSTSYLRYSEGGAQYIRRR